MRVPRRGARPARNRATRAGRRGRGARGRESVACSFDRFSRTCVSLRPGPARVGRLGRSGSPASRLPSPPVLSSPSASGRRWRPAPWRCAALAMVLAWRAQQSDDRERATGQPHGVPHIRLIPPAPFQFHAPQGPCALRLRCGLAGRVCPSRCSPRSACPPGSAAETRTLPLHRVARGQGGSEPPLSWVLSLYGRLSFLHIDFGFGENGAACGRDCLLLELLRRGDIGFERSTRPVENASLVMRRYPVVGLCCVASSTPSFVVVVG